MQDKQDLGFSDTRYTNQKLSYCAKKAIIHINCG